MKAIQILLIALSFAVASVSVTGCNKNQSAPEAVEDAGDVMEDAADDAADSMEDAADEVEEAAE